MVSQNNSEVIKDIVCLPIPFQPMINIHIKGAPIETDDAHEGLESGTKVLIQTSKNL